MEDVLSFLRESQVLSSEDNNIRQNTIVGNYYVDTEDVHNHIVDWVINNLENRNCPYQLAIEIAKCTAQLVIKDQSEITPENENKKKFSNSTLLYAECMRKVQQACASLLEQVPLKGDLCAPLPFATSVYSIRNTRRKMEDRHVVHHNLNALLDLKDLPPHSYYAVFDGHSGVEAATYASATLHATLARHPAFLTDTPAAIADAFRTTDERFLKKCDDQHLKSGSTAVCALIRQKTLYLAWVGDAQAAVIKGGKTVVFTSPHKPDREDERKRIEDSGGEVIADGDIYRVNGVIAVARAFGDPQYKTYLISDPEISVIPLEGDEDFLVLASDGLWDGLSPDEAASFLYRNLAENDANDAAEVAAAKLVHRSKLQGSEDNITAVVVYLRDIASIREVAHRVTQQPKFQDMNGTSKASAHDLKLDLSADNVVNSKKLKNAANVLSSTGITDPSYITSYTKDIAESAAYQNSVEAESPAPEATILSELPTPPIDDVVASQQLEITNNNERCSLSTSLVDKFARLQLQSAGSPMDPTEVGSSFADLTPEEAVNVASSVVSSTIETAVQSLVSSEPSSKVTPTSPVKLNPFAPTFIPNNFQLNNVAPTYYDVVSDPTVSVAEASSPDVVFLHDSANSLKEVPAGTSSADASVIILDQSLDEVQADKAESVVLNVQMKDAGEFLKNRSSNLLQGFDSDVLSSVPSSECNKNEDVQSLPTDILDVAVDQQPQRDDCLMSLDMPDSNRNNPGEETALGLSANNVESELIDLGNAKISEVCPKEGWVKVESIGQPNSAIILEAAASNPATSVETTPDVVSSAPVLPSDCPVNLHKIPDGIPEAEGVVTEDVDSDSEKDGGWSYMRVKPVDSEKKQSAGVKPEHKGASNIKVKKDLSKPLTDKTKIKAFSATDKAKKD